MTHRGGDIEYRYLGDEDAERLYRENPNLGRGPDKYCPTCAKRGTYRWKGQDHECNCTMQLQLHKHYLHAGIGADYQRLSWDDFEGDEKLMTAVAKYLDNHETFVTRGVGLMLHGDVGTGKTFAVTMLMKSLVQMGYDCYATTFSSMIDMFTSGWKSDEERRHFQRRVVQSDVLLLDDIGKELRRKNGLSESTFDDVLRRRTQAGRPTFITTNLTPREMDEGYGRAILSLLKEKSIVHTVKGSDFRPTSNRRMLEEIKRGELRPIV